MKKAEMDSLPTSALFSPRRVGSIDNLIVSSFTPVFEDGGPDCTYFGSAYRNSWISALVRNEAGTLYWVEHTDYAGEPAKARGHSLVTSPDGGPYMAVNPKLPEIGNELNFTWDAKQGLKYVTANPKEPRGEIVVTDKTFAWTEEHGAMELQGKIAGPGVMLIFPLRWEGKAGIQLYYNQQYLVEGTLKGEPVKGFILYEHHYSPVSWRDGTFATGFGGVLLFGNQFDDGSVEMGIAYNGGAKRGAVIVNGKGDELINTGVVDNVDTLTEQGVLTDAVWTFGDGHQWKFACRGDALDYSVLGIKGVPKDKIGGYGLATRVGETRKRVGGWAWGQTGRL